MEKPTLKNAVKSYADINDKKESEARRHFKGLDGTVGTIYAPNLNAGSVQRVDCAAQIEGIDEGLNEEVDPQQSNRDPC